MKFFLVLITFLLTGSSFTQDFLFEITNKKKVDSVINSLSKYSSLNKKDRLSLESMIMSLQMLDAENEVRNVSSVLGDDFYTMIIPKLTAKLDSLIARYFQVEDESASFWKLKIEEFEKKRSQKNSNVVFDNVWNDDNYCFYSNYEPTIIINTSEKSKEIELISKRMVKCFSRQTYTYEERITEENSLLAAIDQVELIDMRYKLKLLFLQNLSNNSSSLNFEDFAERLTKEVLSDKLIGVETKTTVLLSINKLLAQQQIHFKIEDLIANYSSIRALLNEANDTEFQKMTRKEYLNKLNLFELQAYLKLDHFFPEHSLFASEAVDILKHTTFSNENLLLFYVFRSATISKSVLFAQQDAELTKRSFPKLYALNKVQNSLDMMKLRESWNLFQAFFLLKDSEKKENFANESTYYDYLYEIYLFHLRNKNRFDLVPLVMKKALTEKQISSIFLNQFLHLIPKIYSLNNEKENFKWWGKHVKTPYRDSIYFLPPNHITTQMTTFSSLSMNEKTIFLTKAFIEELDKNKYDEQFILSQKYGNHKSDLLSLRNYLEKNRSYEAAYKLSDKLGRIENWDGYRKSIMKFLAERNSNVDASKLSNKTKENKSLKDYQEELRQLNNNLTFSLLIVGVLLLSVTFLFFITRRTKNKLNQKTIELQKERNKFEALSLSIGQIGHLVKNTVSEIYNSYFLSATEEELVIGRKALKRLRNIFERFAENKNSVTQSIEDEIDFAANLILIQNRKFCETKSKQDITDIISLKPALKIKNVPIYTIVNILDNGFKHSSLSDDLLITIYSKKVFKDLENNSNDKSLLVIDSHSNSLKKKQNTTNGGGTEYVELMLRNQSINNDVFYVKGELLSLGYRHMFLLD